MRAIAGGLLATVLLPACRATEEPALDVRWTLSPAAPATGPAMLAVVVNDASGQPVSGAAVRLEAHMSHPGMAPVLASAVETPGSPGRYVIPFEFSMAGDWVLLLSIELPGGRRIERRIEVREVTRSG